MESPWHVYLLGCADGTLYVGISTDVERRVKEHNAGKGSRYIIKKRRPVVLLGLIGAESRGSATSIENVLKSRLNHKQKLLYFGLKGWNPNDDVERE